MGERVPEPTELIYRPNDSWAPILIAIGIAIAAIAVFGIWYWAVVGAGFILGGMRSWWKQDEDEISRMRLEQRTDTAVIPAEPIRRS